MSTFEEKMATSSRKKSVTMSKNIIIRPDPDTSAKVQSAIRLLSETMQINANEPSLAFYRIQEHIRKTYPAIVQKQRELENLQVQIDGLVFDIEYSMEAVKTILNSECHFSNIQTQLQKAILLQKQIHLLNQQQIQQKLFGKRDEKLLHKNQTVVNASLSLSFEQKQTEQSLS
ncbi:unnamed protein product [Didymodactylos carnosus]|uniref:Uncharacterized protein n=1 Tax=Didymodactylos carnosus TaxID=1234261 RepID=A0A814BUS4_9BILA|nr:unnamed protein product [Didymodactylos carnosus]CAF1078634.1 unnamed protein product [Didymodactylos carnosus]CAF3710407.1 unnamed protein product [Didymodactylos carnosus]CAF3842036.1 unnamed protein product [Didymodactylos carnosus]